MLTLVVSAVYAAADTGCCTCVGTSSGAAAACLDRCGYVTIDNAFDPTLLDALQREFGEWMATHDEDVKLHSAVSGMIKRGVRGNRIQIALPDRAPFNTDSVLFNDATFGAAREYVEPNSALTVEFFSLMHNMAGSDTQEWHRDSVQEGGGPEVRVQVPLVDVGEAMGPLEIEPLREHDACGGVVRVLSRKGAATLYTGGTRHRGTANLGSQHRTALDFAYMAPMQATQSAYMGMYRVYARQAQQRHNDRFAALCEQAGPGPCATFNTTDQGAEIDDTLLETVCWWSAFVLTCVVSGTVAWRLGLLD